MSTSPTATGSLSKTPFPQLLVYIADRKLSGSLVFRSVEEGEGAAEHVVYFEEGTAAKVRVAKPVAPLGEVLVELGILDEDGLRASQATLTSQGGLHGELLLRTGRIDRGGLMTGLREQVARKMAFLFTLPKETAYAFYEETNLLEEWGGPELTMVDPLKLIFSAVTLAADVTPIDDLLARLRNATLRLRPDADLTRFGFDALSWLVVERLQTEPARLSVLLEAAIAPEATVKAVVYSLAICRYLDLGSSKQPPPLCADQPAETFRVVRMSRGKAQPGQAAVGRVKLQSKLVSVDNAGRPTAAASGSPATSPSPSARPAEDISARRENILQRAATIDKEDYFKMLGLGRDAAEDAIRGAYVALAKRWHPDRLSADLADARDAAAKVFGRIHEAYETLIDETQRKRYLGLLADGGGTPEEAEQVQRILDAADDFQRAQVFFKKRDLENAELHAERAMKGDPEQADYVALWATLMLQKPDAPMVDLLRALDDALTKDHTCERALLARGNVLKRIGRVEAAMSDYRKVAELYPKNIDAAREIRLYDMRHTKGSGPAMSSSESAQWKVESLFGKLFKR